MKIDIIVNFLKGAKTAEEKKGSTAFHLSHLRELTP
jgi:hypothetical protein